MADQRLGLCIADPEVGTVREGFSTYRRKAGDDLAHRVLGHRFVGCARSADFILVAASDGKDVAKQDF